MFSLQAVENFIWSGGSAALTPSLPSPFPLSLHQSFSPALDTANYYPTPRSPVWQESTKHTERDEAVVTIIHVELKVKANTMSTVNYKKAAQWCLNTTIFMSFFIFALAEIRLNISSFLLRWSANSKTAHPRPHLMRRHSPVSLLSLSLLKPPFSPRLLTGITCTAFQYSRTQFCWSYTVGQLHEYKTVIWSQLVYWHLKWVVTERLPNFSAIQAWPHPSRLTARHVFGKALLLCSHWHARLVWF